MSKFYGDLLREFNDAYTKGFYGGYPVLFKFKTSPTDKVKLKQTYKIHRESDLKDEQEIVRHHVHNGVTLKAACGSAVNSKFKFT